MLTRADLRDFHTAYLDFRKEAGIGGVITSIPHYVVKGVGAVGKGIGNAAIATGRYAFRRPGPVFGAAAVLGVGGYGTYKVLKKMKEGATGDFTVPPQQGVY